MADSTVSSVCVVGAGIVGLSTGLALQRKGLNVTIFDPNEPGSGASFGNAGVIAVSEQLPLASAGTLLKVPRMLLSSGYPFSIKPAYAVRLLPWLLRFLMASRPQQVAAASQALNSLLRHAARAHMDMAHATGATHLLQPVGWLKVYESSQSFKAALPGFRRLQALGVGCDYLDSDGIGAKEPALAPLFQHAVWHPECLQVSDVSQYLQRMFSHFMLCGGAFERAHVTDVCVGDGRVTHVVAGNTRRAVSHVVVCAGAWSKPLAQKLGHRVPLDTERGYHAMFARPAGQTLRGPVYWDEKGIVMAPMARGLRVTTGVEFAGLEGKPDARIVDQLVPAIRKAMPGLLAEPESRWLGFRPSIPDSLPVISSSAALPNAFMAFGHGHVGLTLGPLTGELIANCVLGTAGDIDLHPFRASRF